VLCSSSGVQVLFSVLLYLASFAAAGSRPTQGPGDHQEVFFPVKTCVVIRVISCLLMLICICAPEVCRDRFLLSFLSFAEEAVIIFTLLIPQSHPHY
jgi:hypothetical protein